MVMTKGAKKPQSDLVKARQRKISLCCWLFLLPSLTLYVMFQGYPIVTSIFYSTLDWSGLTSNATFVGTGNYEALFSDRLFINAVKNSFIYMFTTVPILLTLSLALAYIFDSVIKKCVTFLRTIFFLPVVTTSAIMGVIMLFIFGATGAVNEFLAIFGIEGTNWLGSSDTALFTIVLVGVWKDVGIYMIYWLAALQSVPKDVYEAADVDGANKWQTFRSVVFPIILPIGGVIGVLAVINSLKVFDLVQTMTGGGPFYASDVVATFVYRTAFNASGGMPRLGYASAAALIFGVMVITIGAVGNVIKGKLQDK